MRLEKQNEKQKNNYATLILKHKHPSRPANKNIAELFFKAGYIGVWGRGITKILNACKLAGLPEPIMEEYAGGIQITFLKNGKVVENVVENVTENREESILRLIKNDNSITTTKLSQLLNVS